MLAQVVATVNVLKLGAHQLFVQEPDAGVQVAKVSACLQDTLPIRRVKRSMHLSVAGDDGSLVAGGGGGGGGLGIILVIMVALFWKRRTRLPVLACSKSRAASHRAHASSTTAAAAAGVPFVSVGVGVAAVLTLGDCCCRGMHFRDRTSSSSCGCDTRGSVR